MMEFILSILSMILVILVFCVLHSNGSDSMKTEYKNYNNFKNDPLSLSAKLASKKYKSIMIMLSVTFENGDTKYMSIRSSSGKIEYYYNSKQIVFTNKSSPLLNTLNQLFVRYINEGQLLKSDMAGTVYNSTDNIFVFYDDYHGMSYKDTYSVNKKSQKNNNNTNRNNKRTKVNENIDMELKILCDSFKLKYPASYEEFKKKYKVLCKKYHPDVCGSDETMKKINIVFDRIKIYYGKK